MKRNRKLPIVLLLTSGAVLTALTLLFPVIGFLEWVSLTPMIAGLFLLCDQPLLTLKKAYFYGFLTVFCFYFILYHWFLTLYPMDFAGLNGGESVAVIVSGWLGLTLLQAVPGGLTFVLFRWMCKSGCFDRQPVLKIPAFAALWTVFEWTSTLGWTGVPWGRLALGQTEYLANLQSASLFGSYWITFLLITVNGLLVYPFLYPSKRVVCFGLAGVLFVGNLTFGSIRLAVRKSDDTEGRTVKVALIQGNVDSHEKWDVGSRSRIMILQADLTRQAANNGAEIVIWAETALPYSVNRSEYLQEYCSSIAKSNNVTLIVGALYGENEETGRYNSLYLIQPNGRFTLQRYNKRHLVPFGEYVPMRDFFTTVIPPLANLSALDGELIPGTDSNLFDTEYGKLGGMICFDSIYETLSMDSVRDGAELMILSTNDAWFEDSRAIYMHASQSRLRAIETGKTWVRAANTGISMTVTPEGKVTDFLAPLETGFVLTDVQLSAESTLYMKTGNLWVWLCIGFLSGLLSVGILLKKRIN